MAITKIEYFNGPYKIGERLLEPFNHFEWTTNLPDVGTHSITAKVYVDGVLNYTTGPRAIEILPWRGLLDKYPGATKAYSFRKLSKDYTGYSCRVSRPSSYSTLYQDIGFDENNYVDLQAISDFLNGEDGYVNIWYNQAGPDNHFTERGTDYNRGAPLKYADVQAAITNNTKLKIDNSENASGLELPISMDTSSIFIVNEFAEATRHAILLWDEKDGTNRSFNSEGSGYIASGNGNVFYLKDDGTYLNGVLKSPNGTGHEYYAEMVNKKSLISALDWETGAASSSYNHIIGSGKSDGWSEAYDGHKYEMIFYPSTEVMPNIDRAAIENNIMKYYSI